MGIFVNQGQLTDYNLLCVIDIDKYLVDESVDVSAEVNLSMHFNYSSINPYLLGTKKIRPSCFNTHFSSSIVFPIMSKTLETSKSRI